MEAAICITYAYGKIETRTWDTRYRGLVLICASKAPYDDAGILKIAGDKQYGRIHSICPKEPKGMAIAIGRLVDSRLMVPADEDKCFVKYKAPWLVPVVKEFDDHIETTYKEKKLYCHVYEDVQAIEPFEWHGTQGWKILDDDIIAKIKFI